MTRQPCQQRLKEVLHYDPETGVFTWLVATGSRIKVGDVAGYVQPGGYRYIGIDKRRHLAHRLEWLYVHGDWPPEQLDHKNRSRSDNWITNLRLAAPAENNQNLSLARNNTSGHQGVCWAKAKGKWTAQIAVNNKNICLGYFTDISEAIAVREAAKAELHHFSRKP